MKSRDERSRTATRRSQAQPGLDGETLAIEALAFLAASPERLHTFIDTTGVVFDDLRQAASQPGFGSGILAYVLSDDGLLIDFATSRDSDPEETATLIRRIQDRDLADD